jgi:GH24 family phage-related lysozyme (muramidase)
MGARGSRFVCDETAGFGDAVAEVSRRADAPVNSCARETAAEPLLHQIGKMSQAELFACSQHCVASCNGNCNPANPPGFSTHERRNDGIAYSGIPRGGRLRYWQRGIDVDVSRVQAFIREMGQEGWLVTQTYPGSPREAQHVNFRRQPRISLWEFRPLEPGMRGRRVREVVRLLRRIQEPGKRVPYLTGTDKLPVRSFYTKNRAAAVKRFQHDHGMTVDGIVGVRTITVLRGTARRPPSRLDKVGVDFLVGFEGEVLHVYNDPAGHATFGVGHLLHRGPYTQADARKYGTREHPKPRADMLKLSRELLDEDAARFEKAVRRLVPVRWRKSHDRFNSLVSLAFNLGEEILTPGPPLTSFGQALQGKKVKPIADAFLLYVHGRELLADVDPSALVLRADEKVLPGLVRRRKAERALFLRNK